MMEKTIEKTLKLGRLKSVGIDKPWKVPLYLPTEHIDCRFPIEYFGHLEPTDYPVLVRGSVCGEPEVQWRNDAPMTKWTLTDARGAALRFSFFGDARHLVEKIRSIEGLVHLTGRIRYFGSSPFLTHCELVDAEIAGKVLPVYPGKPGKLSPQNAYRLITRLLPQTLDLCASTLRSRLSRHIDSQQIRRLLHCPRWTLEEVLLNAHTPPDPATAEQALSVIDRLAALVATLDLINSAEAVLPSRTLIERPEGWQDLSDAFRFPLTKEQHHGIDRLIALFQQPRASQVLINGDVGTGKSIVYQVAVAYAVCSGARAAVLLPHSRLAAQAWREFRELWPDLPVRLVSGDSGATDEDLSQVPLLVGTTALLHRPVGDFDVVVVDEQQRFSVDQRQLLSSRKAHLIEISATPIPRSMALAVYGAMEVIPITQRHTPQNIRSAIVQRQQVHTMIDQVRKLVEQGSRVLVVCPKRAGDETDSLSSVSRVASRWEALFPGNVRQAESSMDDEVIARAIDDVIQGRAQILIATTVVETGLNIPDLRAVIVTNGDRFGVSQLHQIRGRLAREGGDGWFWIFLPNPVSDKSMTRLAAVVSTCDGFALSKLDMKIRGMGDLSSQGTKQHGSADSLIYNRVVPLELMDEMVELLFFGRSAA